MENEFSNRISVKNIVLAGMFAAFLAVMSQVSLPMPTGVPITVQVFAVALVGVILGWKRGVLAVLVRLHYCMAGDDDFMWYPAKDSEYKAQCCPEYHFIFGWTGCL